MARKEYSQHDIDQKHSFKSLIMRLVRSLLVLTIVLFYIYKKEKHLDFWLVIVPGLCILVSLVFCVVGLRIYKYYQEPLTRKDKGFWIIEIEEKYKRENPKKYQEYLDELAKQKEETKSKVIKK